MAWLTEVSGAPAEPTCNRTAKLALVVDKLNAVSVTLCDTSAEL